MTDNNYSTPPLTAFIAGLCSDSHICTTALSWARLRLNPRARLAPFLLLSRHPRQVSQPP